MTEPDRDEIEALAGEFVLGTLTADERRAAEARRAADPAFSAAVAGWERRLQPLADAAGEVAPPATTFDRILARIGESGEQPGSNVVALHRTVRRWRLSTAIVGAAAAVLAGIVVLDRIEPPPRTEFVAVLTSEGASPAFVASVDVARGTISVRRVVAAAPADKSYELWSIAPNEAPRSLGVVEQVNLSRVLPVSPAGDLTLAITLEPKGGSPDGKPSGAPIFSGTLVATE